MYSGSYEMPRCNACKKEIFPSELSESFSCPKCNGSMIWRCEKCKGTGKKYTCTKCNYESNK
ncbi:MAG TPA: zinc finger domain-containing protein [Nitrososphaeraceae archaeon]